MYCLPAAGLPGPALGPGCLGQQGQGHPQQTCQPHLTVHHSLTGSHLRPHRPHCQTWGSLAYEGSYGATSYSRHLGPMAAYRLAGGPSAGRTPASGNLPSPELLIFFFPALLISFFLGLLISCSFGLLVFSSPPL